MFTIRKLQSKDSLKKLLNITRQTFLQTFVQWNGNYHPHVLLDGENVIGYGMILLEIKFGRTVSHIEDIIIHPDYRRKGLAQMLIKYLINYSFKELKVNKIVLQCDQTLQELYEKCGFTLNGCEMIIRNVAQTTSNVP